MDKKLKQAIMDGDNEKVHSRYDELIENIAKRYEPDTVKKLQKDVEGITFWYA